MDTEAALVEAARQDPNSFGALYARYLERIYAYLWARTDQGEDAADLTQQVFLQALDAFPRYQVQASPFAAWLFRIAHNVAIDWHRRQRPTVPWDKVPESRHPSVADTANDGLLRREDHARLRALLARLHPETREAILLRFTGQLTLAEIGAVLGKSEDATRKQITRALRTLKEQYDDHTR